MTVEEKREALDQVLQSRVLRRCDQLKKMLRFICEAEFEGRGAELNEYLIGLEALGRPASYSPVEDSIVRTSAYELRNKLTRYYSTEAPKAPIRIEIDRGAYVPRFIRQHGSVARVHVASAETGTTPALRSTRTWIRIAAGFIVLALAAYAFLAHPRPAVNPTGNLWTSEMEAFWKPFLSTDTPLMLTYNSRLFLLAPPLDLMVRNWRTNEMSDIPNSPPLMEFQRRMSPERFVETRNYVDFGAMYSVFLLMRTVGRRQSQISLKSSKDLDWTDVFNDNIVFVGGLAGADPRLRKLQEAGDFVEAAEGITNLHPKPGEQAFYSVAPRMSKTGSNYGDKYALLSRFPGPQRGRYVLLIGSAHSELPWALAEYITNPLSMRELMQHVKLPSGELPDAFQVILRVTLQSQVPVRTSYAAHHVVRAPEFSADPTPPKNP